MTLSVDPTACETCAVVARDLERGEVWTCPFCGGVLERRRGKPSNDQRRTGHPWLQLLRDCKKIARWDSLAAPRSTPLPTGDAPPMDSGARPESTDRPDWVGDSRVPLAEGLMLRDRLDRVRLVDARSAGVIEWLVPRARVLLDSAALGGKPAEKDLPMLVGAAFTDPRTWARWHPACPQGDAATALAIRLWREACDRGRVGTRRHGVELLDRAARAWGVA